MRGRLRRCRPSRWRCAGEVPERLNGRDWKSRDGGNLVRGFESLPLRIDETDSPNTLDRPAFYALRPGGWRDFVTVLHPPYTAWNLANVAIGAALAPHLYAGRLARSEEHTSELQSLRHLVCRLLLEKKK